jgi:hypothetical protein
MNRYEAGRNKQEAFLKGEKHYMGLPCRYGHDGLRRVSNTDCVKCRKEYDNSLSARQARERYASKRVPRVYSDRPKFHERDPNRVFKNLLKSAKRRATIFKFEFNLTEADLIKQWSVQKGKCTYTGLPMSKESGVRVANQMKVSIDRINSSLGYVPSNIVLCIVWANQAKNNVDQNVFVDLCRSVVANAVLTMVV